MLLKFNESSEFGEVKNILNDLEGIMIELYDNYIDIDIEPSSDYAIELSLEELEYEGFYITFKHLSDKRRLYPLITETIHMIIDYMNLKEFDTHILVLESPKHHLSKDYKKTYDRIVTIEELEMIKDINYIEVSFTKKKRDSHLNENVKIIDKNIQSIVDTLDGICSTIRVDDGCSVTTNISTDYYKRRILSETYKGGIRYTIKIHPTSEYSITKNLLDSIHTIVDYMKYKGYKSDITAYIRQIKQVNINIYNEKLDRLDDLLNKEFSMFLNDFISIKFTKMENLNESIQTKKEETFNTLNSIADTIRADEGCRITFQHLSTLIIHPSRKVDYKITEQLVDSIHTIVDYARYRGYKSDILCNISGIVSGFNITNHIDKLLDKPFTKYSMYLPQIRIDFKLEDPNQIKMDLTNENMNLELSKDIISTLNGVCDTIQYDEMCKVLKGYLWKHPTNIENKYKIRISSSDKSGYTITRNLLDSIHTIVDYMNYKGYESKVLTDISGDEWRMLPYMEDITNNIDNLLNMPFRNAPTVITIEFILKKTNEILSFKNFIYKL